MDRNIQLPNLTPNSRYVVRFRSISGLGVKSDWSEALEFDTPDMNLWVYPATLETGWTIHSPVGFRYARIGSSASIQGRVAGSAWGNPIITLPLYMRPNQDIAVAAPSSTGFIYVLTINSSGMVTLNNELGEVTVPDWISVDCAFLIG